VEHIGGGETKTRRPMTDEGKRRAGILENSGPVANSRVARSLTD